MMATVALCDLILKNTVYHGTPLQRQQFKLLVEAHERGDHETVEQLSEEVEQHFIRLNRDFVTSVRQQTLRIEVTVCMVYVIFNDYAGFDDKQNVDRSFILSYGDLNQQDRGATGVSYADSRESLRSWRTMVEEKVFPELCIDREYATRRLQASCKGINLVNELVADCKWDELTALLDEDLEMTTELILWLLPTGQMFDPFWDAAYSLVVTQIRRYKAIAENRPDSADPPPAYSATDPNAPPPPPLVSLMRMTGFDVLMSWARGR